MEKTFEIFVSNFLRFSNNQEQLLHQFLDQLWNVSILLWIYEAFVNFFTLWMSDIVYMGYFFPFPINHWHIMLIRIVPSIVNAKGNINFKISRSAENLTPDTTASFVDASFKYFMVIWDSVPVVDTICCRCLWKPLVSIFLRLVQVMMIFVILLAYLTQQHQQSF